MTPLFGLFNLGPQEILVLLVLTIRPEGLFRSTVARTV